MINTTICNCIPESIIQLIRPAMPVLLLLLPFSLQSKVVHIDGTPAASITIWVYFADKPSPSPTPVTTRALARRRKAGFAPAGNKDAPVNTSYLRTVIRIGGRLRQCCKWENAASFDLPVGKLAEIRALPFVVAVAPMRSEHTRGSVPEQRALAKRRSSNPDGYGPMIDELEPLAVPDAHDYLALRFPGVAPGSGVRIALFDGGFRLRHRSLTHLVSRGAILATHDFVDNDSTVEDPDSVFLNSDHPYYENDLHGSMVASLIAAYDPPNFCGAAWGADFLLARTEDSYIHDEYPYQQREVHREEDNWAAAVIWAESLGVDIISSSVGYRTDFEDTVVIEHENGTFDTLVDYRKSDTDGATSVASRAAMEAVKRGVLIINSAGNDGTLGDTTINVPADVDGVIAVGAVDRYGGIAPFSSRGPSADGRIKPDLVAPGEGNVFPDVYYYDAVGSYLSSSGTSFSAPLVTGICALIKQTEPEAPAATIRKKLYESCTFLKNQTTVDNVYGRGLPDALVGVMRSGEIMLTVTDTGNVPLSRTTVTNLDGDSLSITDSAGQCLFTLVPEGAAAFVLQRDGRSRKISYVSTPVRLKEGPCSLTVTVTNNLGRPVAHPVFRYVADSVLYTVEGDSLGHLSVYEFFRLSFNGIVSAEGYIPSDTIRFLLDGESVRQTLRLTPETPTTTPAVSVYPTVLRLSHASPLRIKVRLPDSATTRECTVTIRSISGGLVWSQRRYGTFALFDEQWDCRTAKGSRITPGTYLVFIRYNNRKWRGKVLVTP